MKVDSDNLSSLLRQQLRTDQLLGLRFVPIPQRQVTESTRTHSRSAKVETTQSEISPQELAAKTDALRLLDETQVRDCRKCGLCKTRTKTVFGQGHASARLVFVGEAPGYDEDQQGLAFVGKAGQLLTKMIMAMGLSRDDVFICNVLKCRPPNNRDPAADEISACSPYLREQLTTIQPEVIVALGSPASKTLLNTAQSIGKLRGQFHDYFLSGIQGQGPSIPLMPTYHPAYLLRTPEDKKKTWHDLQLVMSLLGLAAKTGSQSES
ncbi:MAG: uracil-DNA glycosylase [Planctomycetota bacterium]